MSRWVLSPLLCLLLLSIFYAPCIPTSALPIDDASLIQIPQITGKMDPSLLRTLFTPGFHIDFYPIRDLAYWAEIHLFGADVNCVDMKVYHFFNFIFFFLILVFLGRLLNRRMTSGWGTFFGVMIYGLHPIHAESLLWVSAQKDLLALMFGLIAADRIDVWERGESPHRLWNGISAVFFFILSLMSKSSLGLLPIALAFTLLSNRTPRPKSDRRMLLFTAALMVCLGLGWSFLQSTIYTDVNEMRLNYPISYRIQASAAALGKELAGLLDTNVNIVDVENWGSWLSQNRIFVPLGILAWLAYALASVLSLLRGRSSSVALLLGGALLYLPTASLLFPHRNFYSVRYLEPVLIYAWIFSAPRAERWAHRSLKGPWIPSAGLAVSALLMIASAFESETWARSENVFLKGLRLHPQSLMLKRQLSVSFAEDRRWGRLTKSELQQEDEIDREIRDRCLSESSRDLDDDCASVWSSLFLNPDASDATTSRIAETRFRAFVRELLPDRLPRLEARRKVLALSVGIRPPLGGPLAEDMRLSGFEATPDGRMRILAALCFLQDYKQEEKIRERYRTAHLIDPQSIRVFSAELIQKVRKGANLYEASLSMYNNCLIGKNTQSGL